MTEVVFQVKIPSELVRLGYEQEDVQRQVLEWLVLSLFTEGRISSGKAARLLGISRVDFLTLLRKRGIAYINCSPHELEEEVVAMQTLHGGDQV